MPCLQLHNLTKRYHRVTALHNVSFDVEAGEIFGYLGPNGAGKTTTLRLILGLVHPTAGEVKIFGEPVAAALRASRSHHGVAVRERLGFLPGELRLYSDMTGQALLDYFARFRPRCPPVLRDHLLEAFALDSATLRRRVKLLSHGTRQKIGLVIAMQHQPDLLLLDEPTLGLDPLMQRAFMEVIKELANRGTTIFFSSHILSEVENLCQRVAILRAGKLVALESIAALREKMVRRMTVRFDHAPPRLDHVPGIVRTEIRGNELTLFLQGDINPLMQQLARCQIEHLVFPEPELEDIFAHYYHHDSHQSTAPAV
ncbi:MAG: ABC transporter ATP-binding protein [candidate division KSB1 bacterium]|nr:ABC transporter ATP-binding protein [candidate division KSB1 bacterium]